MGRSGRMTDTQLANAVEKPRAGTSSPERAGTHPLLVALWFAAAGGLLEGLVRWLMTSGLRGGMMDQSPHFIWMGAVATGLLLLVPAIVLWAFGRIWPRVSGLAVTTFVFSVPSWFALLLMIPRLHWASALVLAVGLATQTSRLIVRHAHGFAVLVRRSVAAVVLLLVLIGVGTGAGFKFAELRALAGLPAARANAPNVVLIILDTVRAASLSLYGYERPTTPKLAEFARRGVVFETGIATAPWTLPSHASVFTGRLPHELGVDWRVPLDERYPTIAEVLRGRGYLTAGFVANTGYVNKSTGLARGFDHYEDYRISLGEVIRSSSVARFVADNFRVRTILQNDEHLNRKSAAHINDEFLSWLDRKRNRPFFAFLNYYDAHGPYLPPAPYDRMFGARAHGKLSPLHRWNWDPARRHGDLSAQELNEEIAAYDGALAYLDEQLDRLFKSLAERGMLENTVVIITADHGEEFGEHAVYDHGNSLYLPSVHVPLLISYPAGVPAGARISAPVTLRDVPATILDLAQVRDTALPGESLARFWSAQEASENLIVSEVKHATGHPDWFPVSKGDMRGLVAAPYRYIRNGDGTEELYDIGADRWEARNLVAAPAMTEVLERLRAANAQMSGQ